VEAYTNRTIGSMRFGAELTSVGQTLWKDSSAIAEQVLSCNLQRQSRTRGLRKSWSSVTNLADVEAKEGNVVRWRCFVEELHSKAEKHYWLAGSRVSDLKQGD
jgi:hypothetical protein